MLKIYKKRCNCLSTNCISSFFSNFKTTCKIFLTQHFLYFSIPQFFIYCSYYKSLIVSVIAMFRIRFAGAYTAAAAETVSNTTIIAIKTIGRLHWLPKYRVTNFTYKKRLKTIPVPLPTIRPETA